MNISLTLLGDILSGFALMVGALSYFLGPRKTQTPVIAGLLGVPLSATPPFALIRLGVLLFKRDVR